jgi:hypothetical protein
VFIELEEHMLKKIILAAAALGVSTAALAHDDDWGRDRGRGWGWGHERWEHEHRYRPYYYAPRVVVVPAPRVVYAPSPRVAYPYYAAPVYRPAPPAAVYSAPGFSIRFDLPL